MSVNWYAREVQASATRTLQARDIVPGDVILIRPPGEVYRSRREVLAVERHGDAVHIRTRDGVSVHSPGIPFAIVGRVIQ